MSDDHPIEFVTVLGFLVGALAILLFIVSVVASVGEVVVGAVGEATVVIRVTALIIGTIIGWASRPRAGGEVVDE